MSEYADLYQKLNEELGKYNYSQEQDITVPDVRYISYVKQPKFKKVRNLCAVIEAPDDVIDEKTAKRFFTFIRNTLLDKYGEAFLWKELEIMFVVLCNGKTFSMIKENNGKPVDQAQFSMSAMLGTSFVNKETWEHFPHSNWGLYFSGDHFKSVMNTVDAWCDEKSGKAK